MSNNANVQIVLDTGGNVDAKMHEAASSVDDLNSRVSGLGETFRGAFENLPGLLEGGGLESIIGGLGNTLGGLGEAGSEAAAELGPVGVALGAVAAVATAAIGAVVGFALATKEIVEPQIEMIDSTYKMAAALDVPIEKLMTFHNVARLEGDLAAEDVDNAMRKLEKSISGAAVDGGGTEKALEAIGLSAKKLEGMSLDQQFEAVADGLKNIRGQAGYATAATELFGKQGLVIANAFRDGAAGIDEALKKGLEMHTVLNETDAAKVVAAKRAFEELGEQVEGIKNEITVELAPSIQAIGEIIQDLLPDADAMGTVFLDATKGIAYGIAGVMDAYQALKIVVLAVIDVAETFGDDFVQAAAVAGKAILTVVGLIPGLGHAADEAKAQLLEMQSESSAIAGSIHKDFTDASQVSYVAKVGDAFDEAAKKNLDSAGKIVDQTKEGAGKIQEGQEDAAKTLEQSTKKMADALNFEKFLHGSDGGIGAWLESKGVDASKIKEVYDVAKGGGSQDQVMQAAQQEIGLQDAENADKAAKAMDELRNKLALLQGAAKDGIDPKVAEEIEKLHLDPNQAKEFQQLSGAIDAVGEHAKDLAKAAERIKDLKTELAAAQAGLSVDDYKAQQADPASAQQIKALQDQIDKTKEAAKTSEDAHKKLIEDAQKTYEETRTPIEKYWEAVKQLNQELALGSDHGGINKDTYDRALKDLQDKATKEDKHSAEHNEDFATETRRFAQVLPSSNKDETKLLKGQLDIQTQSERWLRDIRNQAVNPSTSSTVSLDSLA